MTPFSCDGSIYQIYNNNPTTLAKYSINNTTVVKTNIGNFGYGEWLNAGWGVWSGNAGGDGYGYAVSGPDYSYLYLYRLGSDGDHVNLGLLRNRKTSSWGLAGDVDDNGRLVTYNFSRNVLSVVDIATVTETHSIPNVYAGRVADFAYNPVDGKFYGIDAVAARVVMFSVDFNGAGKVTNAYVGSYDSRYYLPTNGFGAVWFDENGLMYAFKNSTGEIYQIDVGINGSGVGRPLEITTAALPNGANDGLACSGAPISSAGVISGRVYIDYNNNGAYDAGEAVSTGSVSVNLIDQAKSRVVRTTRTAADGTYRFPSVFTTKTYRVALARATLASPNHTLTTTASISNLKVSDGVTNGGNDFRYAGVDRSDTPASYGEARHSLVPNLYLGDLSDLEVTGISSSDASGDGDDDDGITTFPVLTRGDNSYSIPAENISVTNTTAKPAILYGFIDFNGDGDFADTGETASVAVANGAGNPSADLSFSGFAAVPGSFTSTFARFRLSTDSGLDATTAASDGEVEDYALTITITPRQTLSGVVFEDVDYGGGAGRDFATAGAGVNGAAVELYDSTGALIATTTTANDGTNDGAYAFSSIVAGDYYVRVVSDSVSSTRTGSDGSELAVQTFRTDGSTPVTGEVGGRYPAQADGAANSGTETLNTTTFALSGGGAVQSLQAVSFAGADVTGIDFGFNFSTIVNTNDNGQGSLRQFILNSNLLADIPSQGINPGKESSIFMIPDGSGYAGTAAYGGLDLGAGGVMLIQPNSALPTITDSHTALDASTQNGSSCEPRNITVQLDGSNTTDTIGLTVNASQALLKGWSIGNWGYNALRGSTSDNLVAVCNHFGLDPAGDTVLRNGLDALPTEAENGYGALFTGADIQVGDGSSAGRNVFGGAKNSELAFSAAVRPMVNGNYIGVDHTGQNDAGLGTGSGVFFLAGTRDGRITNNVAAGTAISPIDLQSVNNITVQNNLVGFAADGVTVVSGVNAIVRVQASQSVLIGGTTAGEGNTIVGGITVFGTSSNVDILGNRMGVDVNKDPANHIGAGIAIGNSSNAIRIGDGSAAGANIIAHHSQQGIWVAGTASDVSIRQNSIYANGGLGIDLGFNGVTLNDSFDNDTGPNGLLNFPVLSRVILNGSDLIISGCAPAGAVVELFEADVSPGGAATPGDNQFGLSKDYGEGQTYLISLVEGSVADSDPGSCYIPGEDGNDHSGLNGFYFSVPAPAEVAIDAVLTATATLSGTGTSEFGPMIEISDGPPMIGGGSCTAAGGTDILFIVDNSGSISRREYAEFSQTIETVGAQFLAGNPAHRIAVAHFGGPSDSLFNGGQHVYIERDFSNAGITAPIRQFGHDGAYNSAWFADHLAGAVEQMRYALDGDAATSSNLIVSPLEETSRDLSVPLQVVLMTDAERYLDDTPDDISMLIDPAGSGAEPNDGSDYTVYNQLKNEGVSFSVVSFNPDATDIAASAAIASVGGAYTGTVDANTADPEGSQTTPRRYISVTSGFSLTTDQVLELAETIAICGSSIAGTVFEDLLYGGGNGQPFGADGTVGLDGVTIEVYDSSGAYVAAINTNATGGYRLPKLPDGDYYVRTVNSTVNSSRAGSDGSEIAVMTYRSNGITAVLDEVGGRYPGSVDGDVNSTASTLDTATFVFNDAMSGQVAQSVQPITLTGASVQNADFGFNFNTIVNANSGGQGSLQQFIYNSNLLDSNGIAQSLPVALAGDYSAGDSVAVFMIPTNLLSSGDAVISPAAELAIDQARTVIDGRVQQENIGSGNIVIRGDGSTPHAGVHFTETADGSVLREVSVEEFGGSGISIDGSGAGGTGVTVNTVRVSNNAQYGVFLQNAAANNQIVASTISGNNWAGINNDADGNNTFSRNSITGNGALGIDLGSDGVTPNSAADNWLNYPVIDSNSSVSTNGTLIVSYDFDLDVPANANGYRVEFFSNTTHDASGHGEGETYLGYVDITHPGTGLQNFKGSFNAIQTVPANANIALTLTEKTGADTLGATSEFSGVNNGGLSVCTDLLTDPGAPLPNIMLDENSATVTYLEARDAAGNPVTYTISGGADGGNFVIRPAAPGALFDCLTIEFIKDDDNIIITKKQVVPAQAATTVGLPKLPPPGDYEAPMDSGRDNVYDLEITATDSQGNVVTKPVSIVVLDVNEKPFISTASEIGFEEQQDVATIVVDLEAYDPDAGDAEGGGLTYSISGGPDAGHFSVNRLNGQLHFKVPPNYDLPADSNQDNDYVLEVRVTDDQGYASSKTLMVTVTDNPELGGIRLSIKAFLQGAYELETALMTDKLRELGVLPVSQPYTAAPFDYQGGETISIDKVTMTGAEAAVDWVLVELRSSTDPAQVVATQAALVLRNGMVADAILSSSVLSFANVNPGQYYVSVRHRNHLGVMTATPLALSAGSQLIDFADPDTPVYGQHARYTDGTIALLWSGDVSQDEQLIFSGLGSDINLILSDVLKAPGNTAYNSSFQMLGYHASDLNMDGKTIFTGPSNDANILLGNILLHPGNTVFASNFIVQSEIP